jgi:uracil-DNA glycosylase
VAHEFDPGPVSGKFRELAVNYPGSEAYPPELFRVEWGPVFHRGRLDSTARVLVIGQDPGQHESIGRRCMVGEAGQRVQGFLRKLGISRSYVIVNALLYSVFGQPSASELAAVQSKVRPYREKWFDALLLGNSKVEAVIAFGGAAQEAFEAWLGPESSRKVRVEYAPLLHPTFPEGSKQRGAMKKMLAQWNEALPRLRNALSERDESPDTTPYGTTLKKSDRVEIPERDLPAGTPEFMRSLDEWASREDLLAKNAPKKQKAEAKRATIVVKIPRQERPWKPLDV